MYTVKRTAEFDAWLASIKDVKTHARLVARIRKVQLGNLGDFKPLGAGVFELREHFGPGWRMYCLILDSCVVILPGGGDKASQQRDIPEARAFSKEIEP